MTKPKISYNKVYNLIEQQLDPDDYQDELELEIAIEDMAENQVALLQDFVDHPAKYSE